MFLISVLKAFLVCYINLYFNSLCGFIFLGYSCKSCMKMFSSETVLKKHRIWHHKSEFLPFKYHCRLCPYATNKKFNLSNHSSVHSSCNPHECELCGNRFRTFNSLTNHKIIHYGNQFIF